jgi:hypothetical protein
MTQVVFGFGENNPDIHIKLNQAVQGYRFLMQTVYSGISEPAVHVCTPRTSAFFARVFGPGAGGGGAEGGAGRAAAGGGGAGAYAEYFTTGTPVRQPLTILAPLGAAGGAPGNNFGAVTASGAAILVPSFSAQNPFSTLVAATCGAGGSFMFNSTSTAFVAGGLGGNPFSPGHKVMTGCAGEPGQRLNDIILSGRGGDGIFGGGGAEANELGIPGFNAASYGAGGGGATASTQSLGGGSGGSALVILDEFA